MASIDQPVSLEGWDIARGTDVPWAPWGMEANARVKVLGAADGYTVALIEAPAGYRTAPHEHVYPEFFYLVEGSIRNQGQLLTAGDAYAAAAGSTHADFEVQTPSTYVSIFRLG